MKKSVFTRSIKILIITLLLLAVFFQKERSQKLMALALILWIAVTAGIFLLRKSGKLTKKCGAFFAFLKNAGQMVKASAEKPAEESTIAAAETDPTRPAAPAPDSRETETMLLHIALRITEKLKSAYPQSVWQWKDTPSLQNILAGGTMRIMVENMDTYTHADISFDRFGRIHVEPMVIGSFADVENGANAKPESCTGEETTPEPSVVDVRVWYELIGQTVLEKLITDLNANGHSMLTIKENGDIVVSCQKKKILKATLDSFPGKTYWKELISILEENELKGKISDNSLQVSWI
ncbi:MAG: hypothetical protein K1W41_01230 [Lachnospiraceae bacterium]